MLERQPLQTHFRDLKVTPYKTGSKPKGGPDRRREKTVFTSPPKLSQILSVRCTRMSRKWECHFLDSNFLRFNFSTMCHRELSSLSNSLADLEEGCGWSVWQSCTLQWLIHHIFPSSVFLHLSRVSGDPDRECRRSRTASRGQKNALEVRWSPPWLINDYFLITKK